jgi:hypothetical protein
MKTPSRHHETLRCDIALRQLRRANRWILTASAALTGVLTAVTANASIGKTHKTQHAANTTRRHSTKAHHALAHSHPHSSRPLAAPKQAPQTVPVTPSGPEETSRQSNTQAESAPSSLAPEASVPPSETPSAREAAPAPEAPVSHERAPAPEAPAPESPPVVSGGS